MTLEEREKRIIQYVKDNPGTSEYRVYTNLRNEGIATKDTLISDIARLVKEDKKLIEILTIRKNNSKVYQLFINNENEFFLINFSLSDFESYIKEDRRIIESSKPHPSKKQHAYWIVGILLTILDRDVERLPLEKDQEILRKRIMNMILDANRNEIRRAEKYDPKSLKPDAKLAAKLLRS